jgi:hypothetical protein
MFAPEQVLEHPKELAQEAGQWASPPFRLHLVSSYSGTTPALACHVNSTWRVDHPNSSRTLYPLLRKPATNSLTSPGSPRNLTLT